MTVQIYKTGGHVGRSVRQATLVAEIDLDPSEVPFNLSRFARRHGGDFAQIVHDNSLFEELQPA